MRALRSFRRTALATVLGTILTPPLGASLLLSLVAASPSAAVEPSVSKLAALDGRWQLLQSETDERIRIAAIDAAVQPLTWVVRKMAGRVLRSTTAPRPEVHFVWDGRELFERVPGHRGVEARLVDPEAGTSKAIDPRGEPFEGEWRWTSDGLRFRWRQDQAYGENLYRLDASGHALTIDHAIHVTALDGVGPILYRSRFARIEHPSVSAPGPVDAR